MHFYYIEYKPDCDKTEHEILKRKQGAIRKRELRGTHRDIKRAR
jgi:hypothetical protein